MRIISFIIIALVFSSCFNSKEKKVLVFSKTAGYHHESITDGMAAIAKLGEEHKFKVDTTTDATLFNEQNLAQYSSVIFLSTTGDVLNLNEQNAFERYIQAGGGFVGVHAATDTEYDWPWYNKLVGAYFSSHPKIQEAKLDIVDNSHLSTKHLNKTWKRTDEWYNFKSINEKTKTLITIDESSYEGGENGKNHPVSWYHEYDGGRAWYTALGHTKESYVEPDFLKSLLGGIMYAIGDNTRDYSKAKAPLMPEDNRFTIKKLVEGIYIEPTEMTILPNSDVLVAQRRGEIFRYINATGEQKQIGLIPVYHHTDVANVNAEEGLMGLCKDPNFNKNGFIYLYYAVVDSAVNRLSRFYIDNDSIHMASEKVILDVYSQRDICCHTGGSITFSGDGKYLFVSTGDNATPFDEPGQKYVNNGFGPQDDRPGHQQYDARRSSANTNDLRGKILRISINDDGSYSIPEGNLFAKGTPKTRPEIYVMGNRNPYRISVDQKNNDLFWGEVGPDSNMDKEDRGPMGYDEVNRATKAGNFGWPLFVGNNKPYRSYDYATGVSGELHDAKAPMNNSRNNTGLTELPPAQAAMIYYPYGKSEEFPELGSGGRNAMAGPVYYTDMYPKETRLPDYFNGKLFIYDWIRQWIKVVTLGDDMTITPFLPKAKFANIIDMEVAPNGEIYILEYGNGWFTKNLDAGLSKIVYNAGNRVPTIDSFVVDKDAGIAPHTFTASVKTTDPENDKLTYVWHLGKKDLTTSVPTLTHTLDTKGELSLSVTVKDGSGNEASAKPIIIYSGNKRPEIALTIKGNQSMYFDNNPIAYEIKIDDDQALNMNNLAIVKQMSGGNVNKLGHLAVGSAVGESLINSSDCKSCHKRDTTSIGPSYFEVSKRYLNVGYANTLLAEKIRLGGSGNWGEGAMAAHPTITQSEAMTIADWVLSLAKTDNKTVKSLPLQGKIIAKYDKNRQWESNVFLRASYTDSPTNGAKPLSTSKVIGLKPNFIGANNMDKDNGFQATTIGSKNLAKFSKTNGQAALKQYDLFGVKGIALELYSYASIAGEYKVSIIDKLSNKVIGTSTIATKDKKSVTIMIPKQSSEIRDYVLKSEGPGAKDTSSLYLERIVFLKE